MIKIKVPATSANIGCGFDSLGCALTLYATFTFKNSQQMNISGCPKEYQNELRLNEAVSLLKNTDLSVTAIANEVGFSDAKGLIALIKRRKGCSPSQLRKK